ncbi:pilus assembly protein PilM [Patescibacteria group bacterium]
MFSIFQTQNPLGINISDNSIKLAQLYKNKQPFLFNKIELPEGYVVNGEIKKEEEITKIIKQLINDTNKIKKINTNEVVCSLPETKTYFKNFKIDDNHSENINEIINEKISKYLPAESDLLYIDWKILKCKNKNILKEGSCQVILGAVQKKIAKQYVNILELANLSPISLELESLAISRAVINEQTDNNKTIGILEIGSKFSLFIIHQKNMQKLSLILPISGEKITNLISSTLKINYKEAEKAKKICGLDNLKAKGVVKKILSPILYNLVKKIEAIESYYISYYNGNKLDKIILSGEATLLQGIDTELKKYYKTNFFIANPFENLKVNKKSEQEFKGKNLNIYTTAIGLAMNNGNLAK